MLCHPTGVITAVGGRAANVVQMTPNEESEIADLILRVKTSALVVPDAHMGSNWLPGRRTAADLARGVGLPPLTSSELAIAANIAAVLGGYRGRKLPKPGFCR